MTDEEEAIRLKDVIKSRSDIARLREFYLDVKKDADSISSVRELLPLTPGNDLGYIQPADMERAEWFAEVWESEGCPEIHPRGLHYSILGKGHDRPRADEEYRNDTSSWNDLADGAFYAQVLGLVPSDKILDEKNPDPEVVHEPGGDSPFNSLRDDSGSTVEPGSGYRSGNISEWFDEGIQKPCLVYDSVDELIEREAERVARRVFRGVRFDALRHQSHYVEIWAEKSGVIPERLAEQYGAVLRPAGGGEMSYTMARDAIDRAVERGQDLAVVLITDYDPKGRDMPKSVARKMEVEAAMHDVDVHVHHGAVTKEQVEEFGLPGDPAKTPEGLGDGNTGAIAYESHKEKFLSYAGQHPVEIQAFSSRHPEAFAEEIERYVEPYYDEDLDKRIQNAIYEAREKLEDRVRSKLQSNRGEIKEAFREADEAVEEYLSELGGLYNEMEELLSELRDREEEVSRKVGLSESVRRLQEAVEVDLGDVPDELEVDVPEGSVGNVPSPLLDTDRYFHEQLHEFKSFDIRDE